MLDYETRSQNNESQPPYRDISIPASVNDHSATPLMNNSP